MSWKALFLLLTLSLFILLFLIVFLLLLLLLLSLLLLLLLTLLLLLLLDVALVAYRQAFNDDSLVDWHFLFVSYLILSWQCC